MNIGIDGAPLTIPFPCGTKLYAQQLLTNLAEIDKHNQYTIFSSAKVSIPSQNNFNLIKIPDFIPVLKRQLFLAHYAHKANLDIFHYLEPYGSVLYSHPKIVTTVHDINLKYTYPWLSKHLINRIYCETTRWAVLKRSSACIVVSNFTSSELTRYFEKIGTSAKIYQVLNGLDPQFLKFGSDHKKKVKTPYILTMGDFTPRKNLKRLIYSYSRLPTKIKNRYQLKLLISSSTSSARFYDLARKFRVQNRIKIISDVSFTALMKLYIQASLFIYPSLYEGFGLPILEAMACGCPVITSGQGATKETAGQAALLINPRSTVSINNAIMRVVTQPNLRTKLIKLGKNRSKEFSWEKTAKETLKIYQRTNNISNEKI